MHFRTLQGSKFQKSDVKFPGEMHSTLNSSEYSETQSRRWTKHTHLHTHLTSSFLYSDERVSHQDSSLWNIIFRFSLFFPDPGRQQCYLLWLWLRHIWEQFKFKAVPIYQFLFFFSIHPPPPLHYSHSLSTRFCVPSVPVDGDVKYLNTLCCLGTMHFSRWASAAQTPMYANLHTKQPRMFSI